MVATAAWRRLDVPGRDTVRVLRTGSGWELRGLAEWREPSGNWSLEYAVTCDAQWRTRTAEVLGTARGERVARTITCGATGEWTLDGVPVAAVAGCDDIDLSFTPATNLLPIRRLALNVGETARVRAAWLRVPELDLRPLEQCYRHSAMHTYVYESGGGFRRDLTVDGAGLPLEYPDFWIAERAVVPTRQSRV